MKSKIPRPPRDYGKVVDGFANAVFRFCKTPAWFMMAFGLGFLLLKMAGLEKNYDMFVKYLWINVILWVLFLVLPLVIKLKYFEDIPIGWTRSDFKAWQEFLARFGIKEKASLVSILLAVAVFGSVIGGVILDVVFRTGLISSFVVLGWILIGIAYALKKIRWKKLKFSWTGGNRGAIADAEDYVKNRYKWKQTGVKFLVFSVAILIGFFIVPPIAIGSRTAQQQDVLVFLMFVGVIVWLALCGFSIRDKIRKWNSERNGLLK